MSKYLECPKCHSWIGLGELAKANRHFVQYQFANGISLASCLISCPRCYGSSYWREKSSEIETLKAQNKIDNNLFLPPWNLDDEFSGPYYRLTEKGRKESERSW